MEQNETSDIQGLYMIGYATGKQNFWKELNMKKKDNKNINILNILKSQDQKSANGNRG